jgi:hypothetical protein
MAPFALRPRSLACFALSLSLASCSTTTSSKATPPGLQPDPSPAEETPADGPPCAPPAITFAPSKVKLEKTRDHHVSFVREVAGTPFLYVLGGEDQDFEVLHDDVLRARIGADGELSPFESAGTLPSGRAGSGLAVVGDDVVLAGGVAVGPSLTKEILVGRFDAAGRLDSWKPGGALPQSVQHAAAVAIGRDVYVFGGTRGTSASTISVKFRVTDEGTLSEVVSLTALNPPRSHHVAFVDRDAVYLVGGLDKGPMTNPPSRKDAVRARVLPDGTLSAWETVGGLSNPLSISSVQRVGCSLLFSGGLDETNKEGLYSNRILRASLREDGSFRSETPLEARLGVSRGHVHQMPMYRNFLYSVGGRGNDLTTLGSVEIGTVAP